MTAATTPRPPKETPILYSAPMVRAYLAGQKTQTRRIAKFKPIRDGVNLAFSGVSAGHYCTGVPSSGHVLYARRGNGVWDQLTEPLHCPYGGPGDYLWGRETWKSSNFECDEDWQPDLEDRDSHVCNPHCKQTYVYYKATPRVGYRPLPDKARIRYLDESTPLPDTGWYEKGFKSPLFMPRWASRIRQRIVEVRVQRVQEISEADAIAEGVQPFILPESWSVMRKDGGSHDQFVAPDAEKAAEFAAVVHKPARQVSSARDKYQQLWREINDRRPGCSWDENPWVWCLTFERAEGA